MKKNIMETPIMRFLGNLWDCFLLTMLWLVCSLPIVTIGASTTALYYYTLKLASNQEGALARSYFRAFKINFKQSTCAWMIIMVIGVIGGLDVWFLSGIESFMSTMMLAILGICAVILLCTLLYLPAVMARCRDSLLMLFWRSFTMAIRYFIVTLGMLCVWALSILIALSVTNAMWIILPGFAAYICSYMLNQVFERCGLALDDHMYYDPEGKFSEKIED